MTSKLRWRFSDLRIGAKISVLLATAAAPFLLMTYLFLVQAQKDIAFAKLEMRGVVYLQALNPVLVKLTQQSGGSLDAALLDGVRQQALAFADLGTSAPAVGDFLDAASRPDRLLALEAARTAFQKIADGSRLTLDPGLESSDLVNVVVERAPEVVVAAVGLRRALVYYVRNGRADLPEFGELVGGLTRFGRAREAIQAALLAGGDRAMTGNRQERRAAIENFLSLAHRLSSQAGNAQSAIESDVPVRGTSDLIAITDQVIGEGFAISSLAQADLARILNERIARLEADIGLKLAFVVSFFVFAILVGVLILRSIGGPVKQLIGSIRRLQSGDFDTPVPYTGSRSELGEIARALKQFQSMGAHQALTTAIESSATMLMITDPDGAIAFMSRGLRELVLSIAPALKAADTALSADEIIGVPARRLLGNPALVPTPIQNDDQAEIIRYEIAGRTLQVATSMIRNGAGELIGQTAHWQDITAELASEREIAAVVSAASRGDFDTELELGGKSGAALDIANGLNLISATVRNAALDFASTLDAIAHGDLTRRIERSYGGVFGKLGDAINETGAKLAETLGTIQGTARTAALSASEIRSGACDLSTRTEEQAHALTLSAATIEEMSASVQTHAAVAREAASRADQAKALAERGGAIAVDAVASIVRIEDMSGRIDAVTSVIEEIAFQTNLLALNAAVEAARAGDAGRGFAVVATEVRTLSQRSSQAAKDIGSLLASSSAEVARGVKLVRAVGAALDEIVVASQQLAEAVAGMAAASAEQSAGITQVGQTMEQFDDATRRNAALSEETLAAVTMLTSQMHQLGALVGAFVVSSEQIGSPAVIRSRAA